MTQDKLFIAYEMGHIPEALAQRERGITVVCIDFLVERELKKKNIPFVSLRDFLKVDQDENEWWQLAHDVIREWYRIPSMQFFSYQGIRIAEAPEPIFEAHIARLFYYARIYTALKKKFPDTSFFIPAPTDRKHGDEFLASFQPWAALDAARLVRLPTVSAATRLVSPEYIFTSHTWKSILRNAYNFCISLLPRRGFTIYTSGYWTHLEPVVPHLTDTKLIVWESAHFFRIPWRTRLKYRMRVMRSYDVISRNEEREVRKISLDYTRTWKEARKEVAGFLAQIRGEFDWSPVLEACSAFITYAPRIVADIRALRRIMEKEKPDVVLQMASVGGPQHYFFLMAKVAKLLNIPSVELQHAGATVDPRSVYCRIETNYLLTYGTDVNEWHRRIGAPPKKLIPVGSPRFDRCVHEYEKASRQGKEMYQKLGLDLSRPVLVAVVPFSATYVSAVDSYQLADFYLTVRAIQGKIPNLQILFKIRNNAGVTVLEEYLKDVFDRDYAISGVENIFPLLAASTAVMCNNSTVIYQALLAKKPLVLYPWKYYDSYHARVYERAAPLFYTAEETVDAFVNIFSNPAYAAKLMAQQEEFLKGYIFDGKSSERVAAFLESFRGSRQM